ncbi:MAG TPA: inorganic phosphate transporter [Micromonosporaceae bacterium]|nr:inorganic phosphate transporter [Micromonosporaceae bacterium]
MSLTVVVVIMTALVFDFTNGFHDTANAMATSIATRALRPKIAVALSAVLNVVGAFLSVEVAKTISGGIVNDSLVTPAIVFGGLVGAIIWNLVTWLFGLPSSSSHALIGGLIGATWVAAGGDAVRFAAIVEKVLVPAVLSPIIAGVVAGLGTYAVYRITRTGRADVTARGFRGGQVVSASMVSLAHGTNDAQKTMGVITLTLIAAGELPAGASPPTWVILTAGLAIGLGTYLGGWRIIRTVGHRLTHIASPQGFAAETSAATVILASSHLGYALSTTQVASGSVVGSGVARRSERVHWGTVGQIVLAWALTMPSAGLLGAGAGWVADRGNGGVIVVAILGALAAVGIYLASRRRPVNASNVNDEEREPVVVRKPAAVA